jgi:hypothetical protein
MPGTASPVGVRRIQAVDGGSGRHLLGDERLLVLVGVADDLGDEIVWL